MLCLEEIVQKFPIVMHLIKIIFRFDDITFYSMVFYFVNRLLVFG